MLTNMEQRLASFNRKERFLLVGQALGNAAFTLGETFRLQLGDVLKRDVPANAYCAMDYHLDWLFAALMWAEGLAHPGNLMERNVDAGVAGVPEDLKVTGNQSDIDLLVAWTDERGRGQLALLEAKGYSSWTNKQMLYKAARLTAIFGDHDAPRFPDVDAHLVLVGPHPPVGLKLTTPSWALGPSDGLAKYFLPLDPPPVETFVVRRINQDRKPAVTGTHWVIAPSVSPW
ncbi:hypothetical protein GCM10011519_07430 [Marmoricola endophyticus]|uniref:Uncharacterized protein n=1 Tax=Marmoricola endophyticus TaxID=2040280 RepID=A0A917EZW9_9ACTN|nr:hypothetical protein [Marmoricola endophyticus]GGF36420.1 hypothetical protein GCM10011519_07430 [Marmoricola endophyticus]